MIRRAVASLLACACIGVTAAGCGDDDDSRAAASGGGGDPIPAKLTFAVSDLAGLEELKRNLDPFRKRLSSALGTDVEFFAVPNLNAAVAALESDSVDLVLTGPSEYVVMRARRIAEPLVGINRPDYRSQIIACNDRGARSLDDIRGEKVALAFPGGLATHLAPSAMLADAGLDPQEDVDITLLSEAGPAREACERGDVAATGLKPADYEEFVEQFELDAKAFPILERGPLLPPDVIVASPRLPGPARRAIREKILADEASLLDAILTSGATSDAARASYAEKYEGASFVAVEDGDYDYVRKSFAAIGASDLTQFPGE